MLRPEQSERLLQTDARVRAVHGETVELEVSRASACGACALRAGCGAAAFSALSRPMRISVTCQDGARFAPGDVVDVSADGDAFLRAVAMMFFVPTLAIVGTVAICVWLGLPAVLTGALALLALAMALLPLRLIERRAPFPHKLRIAAPE